MAMPKTKLLNKTMANELVETLKDRFENNMNRHLDLSWAEVFSKLTANPKALWSLNEMEKTGGEPDVVSLSNRSSEICYVDCSAETPIGRRNTCYDRKGLDSRKAHKPDNNAVDMATAFGIEILDELQYRELQEFGNFDTKTSSWLKTPPDVRKLGGAIFGDFRYGRVFVYHNGAQSYYNVRGFRGYLSV